MPCNLQGVHYRPGCRLVVELDSDNSGDVRFVRQREIKGGLSQEPASIAVAIPTFGRDQVLIDTVGHLLRQSRPPKEILILDQSPNSQQPQLSALRFSWGRVAGETLSFCERLLHRDVRALLLF
jgi:hypothetical protein